MEPGIPTKAYISHGVIDNNYSLTFGWGIDSNHNGIVGDEIQGVKDRFVLDSDTITLTEDENGAVTHFMTQVSSKSDENDVRSSEIRSLSANRISYTASSGSGAFFITNKKEYFHLRSGDKPVKLNAQGDERTASSKPIFFHSNENLLIVLNNGQLSLLTDDKSHQADRQGSYNTLGASIDIEKNEKVVDFESNPKSGLIVILTNKGRLLSWLKVNNKVSEDLKDVTTTFIKPLNLSEIDSSIIKNFAITNNGKHIIATTDFGYLIDLLPALSYKNISEVIKVKAEEIEEPNGVKNRIKQVITVGSKTILLTENNNILVRDSNSMLAVFIPFKANFGKPNSQILNDISNLQVSENLFATTAINGNVNVCSPDGSCVDIGTPKQLLKNKNSGFSYVSQDTNELIELSSQPKSQYTNFKNSHTGYRAYFKKLKDGETITDVIATPTITLYKTSLNDYITFNPRYSIGGNLSRWFRKHCLPWSNARYTILESSQRVLKVAPFGEGIGVLFRDHKFEYYSSKSSVLNFNKAVKELNINLNSNVAFFSGTNGSSIIELQDGSSYIFNINSTPDGGTINEGILSFGIKRIITSPFESIGAMLTTDDKLAWFNLKTNDPIANYNDSKNPLVDIYETEDLRTKGLIESLHGKSLYSEFNIKKDIDGEYEYKPFSEDLFNQNATSEKIVARNSKDFAYYFKNKSVFAGRERIFVDTKNEKPNDIAIIGGTAYVITSTGNLYTGSIDGSQKKKVGNFLRFENSSIQSKDRFVSLIPTSETSFYNIKEDGTFKRVDMPRNTKVKRIISGYTDNKTQLLNKTFIVVDDMGNSNIYDTNTLTPKSSNTNDIEKLIQKVKFLKKIYISTTKKNNIVVVLLTENGVLVREIFDSLGKREGSTNDDFLYSRGASNIQSIYAIKGTLIEVDKNGEFLFEGNDDAIPASANEVNALITQYRAKKIHLLADGFIIETEGGKILPFLNDEDIISSPTGDKLKVIKNSKLNITTDN
ncbi:hypothetical protein [Photobacterium kishitanii]|uniref:hypothetical protein n=1 Tax=Photobacterium kishitanii TaxID=318456 RepID=UPI0011B23B7E|nr:hypothetical protein [Photobacterium kishitanii]